MSKHDDLLPSASDYMGQVAVALSKKDEEDAKKNAKAEAAKKALLDQLTGRMKLSEEDAMKRVKQIVENAVKNRMTEVQLLTFPSDICTDRGRALNQLEPGWEQTLVGIPKDVYEFWKKNLQPKGYRLRVQIISFPDNMPGDAAMTLVWAPQTNT